MPDLTTLSIVPWQTADIDNRMERVKSSFDSQKLPSSVEGDSQLKKACAELESFFVYQLLKAMRNTVPKSGLISGGKAEEMYTSMLDFELAKEISSKGGIGLSGPLLKQLGNGTEHNE